MTGSLVLGTSTGTWASGVVSVQADLALSRSTPNGPFESFNLGIDPIDPVDSEVKLSAYNLDTSVPADTADRGLVGTSKIRFGRLRMFNATGLATQLLPLTLRTEYWNGTAFVTNADDSCTTLARANIALGGYAGSLGACETILNSDPMTFASGIGTGAGTLGMTAPGATNQGSVILTPQLGAVASGNYCAAVGAGPGPSAIAATKSYLQGAWTGGTYTENPTARAAFGVYGAQPKNFIFFRENY